MPKLLTIKDISAHFNISTQMIGRLIKSRNVPIAMYAGKSPLIEPKHLKLFADRKRGNPHRKK